MILEQAGSCPVRSQSIAREINRGIRIKHITRDIVKEIMQRKLRKEHERDPGQLNESTEVLWPLAGSGVEMQMGLRIYIG